MPLSFLKSFSSLAFSTIIGKSLWSIFHAKLTSFKPCTTEITHFIRVLIFFLTARNKMIYSLNPVNRIESTEEFAYSVQKMILNLTKCSCYKLCERSNQNLECVLNTCPKILSLFTKGSYTSSNRIFLKDPLFKILTHIMEKY